MYNRAANRYRSVSLNSASPTQVLGEVFHRLAADLELAARCIQTRDISGKSKAINHAIDLVSALAQSLDHESAPEMCENLARLYQFAQDRMLEASVKLDVAPLREAERVLWSVRDAFVEAAAQSVQP